MGAQIQGAVEEARELQGPASSGGDAQVIALWLGRFDSPHTRRAYRRQAARFLAFVGRPLGAVTLADVQAFSATLGDAAPATRANAMAVLKSLFGFAQEIGYIRYNVTKPVKLPKVRNRLPERMMDEADTLRLIAGEPNPRNRALLTLIYGGGLRVSEAPALCWRDTMRRDEQGGVEAGQVTVHGKGGVTRVILLSPNTWRLLSALRQDGGADEPIFRSRKRGGRLDQSQVHRIVKAAAARAGLSPQVSAHWLRHAHATHALDRGAPISLVRQTLGHASIATTGRYLHAKPADSSARYLLV
jgi:integrase/recombinase XerD